MFHYFRNTEFTAKPWLNGALAFLRGTVVTLIAIMLLNPVVRSIHEEVKTPIVLIGVDQSQSITENSSQAQLNTLTSSMENLHDQLSEKYDVRLFSIGQETKEGLDTAFQSSQSNLASFLELASDQFAHLNVGAMVLASDGIYNVGKNPLYTGKRLKAPLHTIRLGDSTTPRDINIRNIFHNEIAFLNDDFEVEVDIDANNATGQNLRLQLQRYQGNGFTTLKEANQSIDQDDQFFTIPFQLNANQNGVQRYRVVASPISSEKNTKNNVRDFFIEVLDSRIKIVLVKNAPHPDIAAIRSIVQTSENYELEVVDLREAFNATPDADLVILHGLPSPTHNLDGLVQQLNVQRTPRLFILTTSVDANRFNQIQSSLSLSGANGSSNDVQALVDPQFNIFEIDEELPQRLLDYPPLISPFAEYTLTNGAKALAHQKIGSVSTSYPLISFNESQGIKEGIIAGGGIWRWRLVDYVKNGQHELIDGLVRKVFQYLSIKENKEQFRVRSQKNLYDENEAVIFTAEVYNNAYEPITDPEVYLTIVSDAGEEYQFTFTRGTKSYHLDAGRLKPGNYTYQSRTTYNGKEYGARGNFAIKAIELEYYNTVADHNLLRTLSNEYGGQSYDLNQVKSLENALLETELKPTVVYASRTKSAMNFKWIFGLLALLLSLEWFLRRYFGRY